MKVGVIADTHGLLREEVVAQLRGCDRIIHAGDVGKEEVLTRLQEIAPTFAVRGNVDRGDWAELLPLTQTVTWESVTIHILHDLGDLTAGPRPPDAQIVISGHSHQAWLEEKSGVSYLNPGSVGPRRFRLPVTMAILHLPGGGRRQVEPITLF